MKKSPYRTKSDKKMNRYQVLFWYPARQGPGIVCQICGSFKSLAAARRRAEKINAKHCQVTRYMRRRYRFVDIFKTGIGTVEELEPIIVPSVGELGYTP